jgi:hypothetical protein
MSGIRGPLVGRYDRGLPIAIVSVVGLEGSSAWDHEPLRLHRLLRRSLGLPLRWLCVISILNAFTSPGSSSSPDTFAPLHQSACASASTHADDPPGPAISYQMIVLSHVPYKEEETAIPSESISELSLVLRHWLTVTP